MSKRLVLFSQPSLFVWNQLDLELFPGFLADRMIAYMPCEGEAVEFNAQFVPIWEGFAQKHHAKLVPIDNSKRDQEALREADKLLSANILMITGGNTFKLLDHLRKSGLDQAIREFFRRDNVVLSGFSAGAIILSPSIATAGIYGDINEPQLTDLSGLSIVDFEIWPHYEDDQAQKVADYRTTCSREVKLIRHDEVMV